MPPAQATSGVLSVTMHTSSWGQPDPNLLNKKHSVKTNSTHLFRNCADATPGPDKAAAAPTEPCRVRP